MMIVVNGIPKSGTHALLKAVHLNRPVDNTTEIIHAHARYPNVNVAVDKHIMIVRNPRNVVVSVARNLHKPVTEETISGVINGFFDSSKSFQKVADQYAPYLQDPLTLTVKYEELISNISVIHGICEFLDWPYMDGTFEILPNSWTATNRLPHSDWRIHWTDNIQTVWKDNGLEWEKMLGYQNG